MNFLSKLARYCNFEQQVISLNLPNRRTILTCGKRTVVVYLICKIYNYISSRTIRFRRKVPSFIEPVCEGIKETPKKVALKLIITITIIIAWLFPFSFKNIATKQILAFSHLAKLCQIRNNFHNKC